MVLLVAQLWFRIPFAGSFVTLYVGLGVFLLAAIGIGLLLSSVADDHAAGDAIFFSSDHAVFIVIRVDHADQQYAGGSAVPDVDQSIALCHRYCSSGLSRGSRPEFIDTRTLAAGAHRRGYALGSLMDVSPSANVSRDMQRYFRSRTIYMSLVEFASKFAAVSGIDVPGFGMLGRPEL